MQNQEEPLLEVSRDKFDSIPSIKEENLTDDDEISRKISVVKKKIKSEIKNDACVTLEDDGLETSAVTKIQKSIKTEPVEIECFVETGKVQEEIKEELHEQAGSEMYDIGTTVILMNHIKNEPITHDQCYDQPRYDNIHLVDNTGQKSFVCEPCGYQTTTKPGLIAHMRQHMVAKPFACDECQVRCSTKSNLTVHKKRHTGEKPFACDQCEYRCVRNSELMFHKRRHTGEKPFACDHCNYRSTWKMGVALHIRRVHTREKPFACDVCPVRCSTKSNLTVHKRRHAGEKPFACDQCEYRCVRKIELIIHYRRHTGEKPFSCDQCEYRCIRKAALIFHKRKHTERNPSLIIGPPVTLKVDIASPNENLHWGEDFVLGHV